MPVVVDVHGVRHGFSKMTTEEYISYKIVKRLNGCIEWHGKLTHNGYAEFPKSIANRVGFWLVYHYVYYKKTGRRVVPPMSIDHTCENRRCIAPRHLREMTLRENILRGGAVSAVNARKTQCPRGHEYDMVIPSTGERSCRQCRNRQAREYQRRKRESHE